MIQRKCFHVLITVRWLLSSMLGRFMHQTALLINGRNTHLRKYILHNNVMTNPDCISPTSKSSLVGSQVQTVRMTPKVGRVKTCVESQC